MLIIIGLSVSRDYLTPKAMSALSMCSEILVDTYTSVWYPSIDSLLKELRNRGLNAKPCKRRDLEGDSMAAILKRAKETNVCIAVPGDPFFATTHVALIAEAQRLGVEVSLVPGVSIVNFVYAYTCLQPYRFGKIATVVAPKEGIFYEYPIRVIKENRDRNLHTILLLEIDIEKNFFMTPKQAMEILLEAQRRTGEEVIMSDDRIFVLSSIGSSNECVEVTTPMDIVNERNMCRAPPATLVIPARKLHPIEEECIEALYHKRLLRRT